jgi:hypothetical protein
VPLLTVPPLGSPSPLGGECSVPGGVTEQAVSEATARRRAKSSKIFMRDSHLSHSAGGCQVKFL